MPDFTPTGRPTDYTPQSMSITQAKEARIKLASESLIYRFDFGPLLEASETLVGATLTVTANQSGLVIGSPSIGSAALTKDDGTTATANEWCQCRVSSGTAGVRYTLTVTANPTSSSNIRSMEAILDVN